MSADNRSQQLPPTRVKSKWPTRFTKVLRNRLRILHRNTFAHWHLATSKARLHALLRSRGGSAAGLVAVTNDFKGKGWFEAITGWQEPTEFVSMVEWVQAQRPDNVLEIGTAKGATLLAWCRLARTRVISVDLPGGIHGGGYPAIKQALYQQFLVDRPGVTLHCLQKNSHLEATRDWAKAILREDELDILYIDGDHTYAGVKADFELWSPLVRPGGHVIFHDILPHKFVTDCEVNRLWAELKPRYVWKEIVADPRQGWAGIGIITLPA